MSAKDYAQLYEKLAEINETLAQQGKDLADHIKRTALLEEAILPLLKAKSWLEVSLAIVGATGTFLTMVSALMKILGIGKFFN